ncbi:MAG TPA: hypothetical protein VFH47_08945, partial [Candidatus Thermoplasmatota archaeon]|nr:hypothetical protein [Candidatus Thermoplasmatota archaeon]
MDFIDKLKKILRSTDPVDDPYTPAIAAILPFFDKMANYEPEEFAQEVLRTLFLAQNPNQTWEFHRAYNMRQGLPTKMPSSETLRRALRRPPPRKGRIKADRIEQATHHSDVFLAQALAFIEAVQAQDGDLYATMDGSAAPKYGEKAYESKRPLHKQTEASLSAQPILRTKSTSASKAKEATPFFKGTTGGHERLFVTLHHTRSKESLVVFVDPHAKEDFLGAVRRGIAALERLPMKLGFIVVDKQFGGGHVW